MNNIFEQKCIYTSILRKEKKRDNNVLTTRIYQNNSFYIFLFFVFSVAEKSSVYIYI